MQRPSPSALFTGREAEIARVRAALSRVRIAWIDGVAGVGKTTLALALAEHWDGPVVFCDAGSAPLDALLDDARLALGPAARPEPKSNTERITDLVRRMEARAVLLLVDDAHLLPDSDSAELLTALGAALAKGRAIFTSRRRFAGDARAPDHAELHLQGLDVEAARRLWSSLDELCGRRSGFEAAHARCQGHPLFLRRAHAGSLDDDPLTSQMRELPSEARRMALALALAGQPLPARVFEPDGRRVLTALADSLVIEIDGARNVSLHDLFRDALIEQASAEELAEVRVELARMLRDAELVPALEIREVTRQLAELGRHAELDEFLCSRATRAVRAGATGELLRAMDRVPAELRSTALSVERARCIGRHYDQPLAYEELSRLIAASAAPPPELAYAFAEAAYDLCRAEEVLTTLAPLLDRDDVDPELRVRMLARYTAALTVLGRGDEGRARLAAEESATTEPARRARLALQIAMLHNADEEYEQAARVLSRARSLLDANAIDENALYVPLMFAVIYARAGRFAECDALIERIDLTASFEDESAREFVTASRASLAFERGERALAREQRLLAQRGNEALGNVHYDFTNAIWHSRLLFSLGRRREAYALADAALARAGSLGCLGIAARLERSRACDPLIQLERLDLHGRPAPERRGERARALALAALRASARGVPPEADLAELEALSTGPGYALERAIHELCRALACEQAGDREAARRHRGEAARQAAAEDVDADLLVELERRARAAARGDAKPIVLDERTHELCGGPSTLELKKRPVLRRLLYALAVAPARVVSKEALVEATWSVAYDPLRHDTPLWQNIHRLRRLIEPARLGIEVDEQGYRLIAPPEFRFERAGELSAAPEPRRPR